MKPSTFVTSGTCLAVSLLLAACGGGGSGGGSSIFDTGTGFNDAVVSIAIANDGSDDVYVAGAFTSYDGTARSHLARLNSDGSVDTGFDPGQGTNGSIFAVVDTTDGSDDIYIAGNFTTYDGVSRNRIARVHSDGSLDTAFDVGSGFDSYPSCLAIATNGSGDVYAGGTFNQYNGTTSYSIIRLNSDGSVDGGFSTGTGFGAYSVNDLKPAADGSGDIYAVGNFPTYRGNSRNGVVRINSTGSNDAGFNPGSGASNAVFGVEVADDGSGDIYIGGNFAQYNGVSSTNGVVRINSDGSADSSFDSGSGFDHNVETLVNAADGTGRIYAGGSFTTYRGNSRNCIASIYSDGSNDGSFSPGTGCAGGPSTPTVYTIALRNDGSGDIYVGGNFTSFNSATAGRIVRLDASGSPD